MERLRLQQSQDYSEHLSCNLWLKSRLSSRWSHTLAPAFSVVALYLRSESKLQKRAGRVLYLLCFLFCLVFHLSEEHIFFITGFVFIMSLNIGQQLNAVFAMWLRRCMFLSAHGFLSLAVTEISCNQALLWELPLLNSKVKPVHLCCKLSFSHHQFKLCF